MVRWFRVGILLLCLLYLLHSMYTNLSVGGGGGNFRTVPSIIFMVFFEYAKGEVR